MRAAPAFAALTLAICGCSAYTERQSLGYGDYVAFSCDELGQEALRLMRQTTSRNEYLLDDDKTRRDAAMRQLRAVKQASTDKGCLAKSGGSSSLPSSLSRDG
jgi:hypothetical protein